MKKSLLASALALTSIGVSAQELSTVTTVADRIAAPVVNDAQIVVIDREEIELSGASNIAALLSTKAGFQYSQNGGVTSSANLYIRGLSNQQTLTLINGQRVGSATSGTTAFQLVPLEQIERIEIIKGSRAAAYGADAQAGVINIITRNDSDQTSISATVGTDVTRGIGVRSSLVRENFSTYAGLTHDASDGYDIGHDGTDDRDGFERNALTLGAAYNISSDQTVQLDLQQNTGISDYDNSWGDDDRLQFNNAAYTAAYLLNREQVSLNLRTGRAYDRNRYYGSATSQENPAYGYYTRKDSTELTTVYTPVDGHSIITGMDIRTEKVDAESSTFNKDTGHNSGASLAYRFNGEALALEAGARFDNNNNYGEFWSFNTAANFTFHNGDSVAVGQATAFRAPTFNELYSPWGSNPDLKPETSRIWSIDYLIPVTVSENQGELTLSGQRALFRNQIVFDGVTYLPDNVGQSYINFAALTWDQDWSSSLSTVFIQEWTEAMNLETDKHQVRRPIRSTKLNVEWVNGKWTTRLENLYRDQSYDFDYDAYADTVVPGAYICNISAKYQATSKFDMTLRVDNIGDRDYASIVNYPARGRYAQLSGRFQF